MTLLRLGFLLQVKLFTEAAPAAAAPACDYHYV